MIELGTFFWILVALFALIGALRGWTREVIATAGLILSLFALNQFGPLIVGVARAGLETGMAADIPQEGIRRQQFYILTTIHLIITFFSYQGPALAGSRMGDRLRIRDNFQDKLLGGIIGMVNGYLVVGTIWSFLEYQIIDAGYQQLPPGVQYPFDTIMRPGVDSHLMTLIARLPLPLLADYLPFLLVAVFLFVLIVMI
jgi:uncharacterized membrane protein required for colicin V production